MTDEDVAPLVGIVAALAFLAHVVIAGMMTLPDEESPAQPFDEAFIEVAPYIWGLVGVCVVAIAIFAIVTIGTDYLINGGLKRDIQRWRNG